MHRCPFCGYDRAAGARCVQCGSPLPVVEAPPPMPPTQRHAWSAHLGIGWSVYWRTALFESLTAVGGLMLDPGTTARALAPLLLSPLIHDWATKTVLRKRYGVIIGRFIGFQLSGALLCALIVSWTVFGMVAALLLGTLLRRGPALSPTGWTVALALVGAGALAVPVVAYGYAAHAALRRRLGFEIVGVTGFLAGVAAVLLH